jgi:hypothetical protein
MRYELIKRMDCQQADAAEQAEQSPLFVAREIDRTFVS